MLKRFICGYGHFGVEIFILIRLEEESEQFVGYDVFFKILVIGGVLAKLTDFMVFDDYARDQK